MPYRIKRVKDPIAAALIGGALPATHYARSVDATGYVTGWTPEADAAGAFDEAAVARVRAAYKGRANAGTLTFERLAAPKAPEAAEPVRLEARPEPPAAAQPVAVSPPAAPPAPQAPPKQPEPEKTSGRKAR
jgi:hypothetical protein